MDTNEPNITIRGDVEFTPIESPYVDDDFRVQKDTFERRHEPDVRVYVVPRDANTALECYARDPEFKQAVDLVARGDVPGGDDFPDEPAEVLRSNAGRQLAVEAQYLGGPDAFRSFDECVDRMRDRVDDPEAFCANDVARTEVADAHRKAARDSMLSGGVTDKGRDRPSFTGHPPPEPQGSTSEDRRFVVTLAVERVANRIATTLQAGVDRLMVDTSDPKPDPVDEAKQAYIDGDLTIDEYEDRLEDVLEE